jgi:Na+/proline symporter
MTGDETALEVLRMTAEIRSGHTSVVTSAVIAAANALVTLGALLILTGSGAIDKGVFSLLLWSLALSVLGVLVIGFGWKRLNNAIKSNNKEQKVITGKTTPTLPDVETSALSPQPVSFSVTEETTELLNQNEETPAFVNRSHNKKT